MSIPATAAATDAAYTEKKAGPRDQLFDLIRHGNPVVGVPGSSITELNAVQ